MAALNHVLRRRDLTVGAKQKLWPEGETASTVRMPSDTDLAGAARRRAAWIASTILVMHGVDVAAEYDPQSYSLARVLRHVVAHFAEPAERGGHESADLTVWLDSRLLAVVTRGPAGPVVTRFDAKPKAVPTHPASRNVGPSLFDFDPGRVGGFGSDVPADPPRAASRLSVAGRGGEVIGSTPPPQSESSSPLNRLPTGAEPDH